MRAYTQEPAADQEPAQTKEPHGFDREAPDCGARAGADAGISLGETPMSRGSEFDSEGAIDASSSTGSQETRQRVEPDERMVRAHLDAVTLCATRAVPTTEIHRYRFTMVAIDPEGGKPTFKHFLPGDVDGMIKFAVQRSRRGQNLYLPYVLYHWDLLKTKVSTSRGAAIDIAFVLGLGCDLDLDHGQDVSVVEGINPAPTFVIETSRSPDGPNRQGVFLFSEPLIATKAAPTASALSKLIGDKGGATADVNRIWRVPGLPNYVSKAKAVRRGMQWPCAPQLVRIDRELSTSREVSHEALKAFFDIEQEGHDHAEAERLQGYVPKPHPADKDGLLQIGKEICSGHKGEYARLVDAFLANDRHLAWTSLEKGVGIECFGQTWNIRNYDTYIRVGFALHVFFGGHPMGFALWRSISAGDESLGFRGAPDKWDEATAQKHWASFQEPFGENLLRGRFITVSTFIVIAGWRCGFDLRLDRYGLKSTPPAKSKPCEEAVVVIEAGRVFHALAEVPDHNGVVRDLRAQAIKALRRHLEKAAARRRTMQVFNILVDDLHGGGNPDLPVGVGFRSGATIRDLLNAGGSARWTKDDLLHELVALASHGVIVFSPGRKVGAHGRKGLSYAITAPAGQTWETLIEAHRHDLGHGSRTARVGNKGTPSGERDTSRTEKGVPQRQSGMSTPHSPTEQTESDQQAQSAASAAAASSAPGSAPTSATRSARAHASPASTPGVQTQRPEGSAGNVTLAGTIADLTQWAETTEVLPDGGDPADPSGSPVVLVLTCLNRPRSHKRVVTLERLLREAAEHGASTDQIISAVENAWRWEAKSTRRNWQQLCGEKPTHALAFLTGEIVHQLGKHHGLSHWKAFQTEAAKRERGKRYAQFRRDTAHGAASNTPPEHSEGS